ncbi:unnamed protein product [Coregonus sp. 'balchen']|nr:unnamed protein product [Coregonus sp. 'balchen']
MQQCAFPGVDVQGNKVTRSTNPGFSSEGLRHGLGQLTFSDGTCYTGQFENGLFNGCGMLVFPDGSSRFDGMKFQGEFKSGCVEGYGMLTFADGGPESGRGGGRGGTSHEGLFESGQLVGREGCQGTVQRAQGAAAKARALSM